MSDEPGTSPQSGGPQDADAPVPTPADMTSPAGAPAGDAGVDQAAIDELLKQAAFDDPSALTDPAPAEEPESADADTAVATAPVGDDFPLPNFSQVVQDAQVSNIDLLKDVELNVKIELGRSRMLVEDVLKLAEGSVVELDKLAGDPVDVFVNERLVARGEVLVLNDNFCVRVNEIVAVAKEEGL